MFDCSLFFKFRGSEFEQKLLCFKQAINFCIISKLKYQTSFSRFLKSDNFPIIFWPNTSAQTNLGPITSSFLLIFSSLMFKIKTVKTLKFTKLMVQFWEQDALQSHWSYKIFLKSISKFSKFLSFEQNFFTGDFAVMLIRIPDVGSVKHYIIQ